MSAPGHVSTAALVQRPLHCVIPLTSIVFRASVWSHVVHNTVITINVIMVEARPSARLGEPITYRRRE